MKKYKSLNNRTVDEIKNGISKKLHCKSSDIRLFGSRISGASKENSDLGVAILDENKSEIEYINIFGLKAEIHYVDSFEDSYLKYYSI